jgi:alpha-tubulin suppressor-like RCC1 family protein
LLFQIEFVSSGPSSVHIFAIADTGAVYSWGRNDKGQLGLGDTKDRKCPTLVEALSGYRVVKIATGKNHSLFLTGKMFNLFFEIYLVSLCIIGDRTIDI